MVTSRYPSHHVHIHRTHTSSLGVILIIAAIAGFWFLLVQKTVPDPYLDEVFHVRQAENYVDGNWHVWDPKITTPPGLYLASYIFAIPCKVSGLIDINTTFFRLINWVGAILLAWVIFDILYTLNCTIEHGPEGDPINEHSAVKWSPTEVIHVGVNACLFPPLFFFYGLYYTDILSALSVLFVYRCYLLKKSHAIIIGAGLVSLLFRQTNVLWVSLFLGGLAFCHSVPKGQPNFGFSPVAYFNGIFQASCHFASAYDPTISQASFEDYVKAGLSFAVAGISNLRDVLWSLNPYLIILSVFVQYVIWNGGIVLGDKENHIVSIHLAQILYLWPCFAFFSLPLLYPYILNISPRTVIPPALCISSISNSGPRITVAVPIMLVMSVIAHYNTLVHPFILADNRHYIFYVFRILLRHPMIKYLAVPIYFLCAWAAITALGGQQADNALSERGNPPQTTWEQRRGQIRTRISASDPRASFFLIWLFATIASLVTTPLVEPRYFILPWLMWRIHVVPLRRDHAADTRSLTVGKANTSPSQTKGILCTGHDHRLWIETAWLLTINMTTGYIFLKWGFEWPQEPGLVQRFMW